MAPNLIIHWKISLFQKCDKNIRDLYYGENQYFLSSIKFCKITVTKNRSFLATFLFPSSLRKQKINGDLQENDINWIVSNFFFSKRFFIFIFITCYQKSLSAHVLGGGRFAAFYKNDTIFGNIVYHSEKDKFLEYLIFKNPSKSVLEMWNLP